MCGCPSPQPSPRAVGTRGAVGAFHPHLEGCIRDNAARNHWTHAKAATEALQKLVRQDAAERQLTDSDIRFEERMFIPAEYVPLFKEKGWV